MFSLPVVFYKTECIQVISMHYNIYHLVNPAGISKQHPYFKVLVLKVNIR